jgi:hypothetical protein
VVEMSLFSKLLKTRLQRVLQGTQQVIDPAWVDALRIKKKFPFIVRWSSLI